MPDLNVPDPAGRADLVVAGGGVVAPQGVRVASVAVTGGKIVAITPPGDAPPARRVIDARGHYVLPGLVDSHVHFRTPGLTHKEDWPHASRAAVAGGITTVIDMPNTVPALLDPAAAAEKAALIQGESLVDFRFHLGVATGRPELLSTATPQEAVSAKVFLTGHHTAPHVVRGPELLDEIFARAAAAGIRLVLHAEDMTYGLLHGTQPQPRPHRDHGQDQPRDSAIIAAAKIADLVRRHGTQAHILHVSSADEADLLAAAAAAGLPVTFEVTPHHLSFTAADMRRLGSRAYLSPALRSGRDRQRLWDAVVSGEAATIGSDHAPHTAAEKQRPAPHAPPGLPGVEELLPVVFTGLGRERPELDTDARLRLIARVCAGNPARMFGLAARKGRVAVGTDADLSVFDPAQRWTVGSRPPQSKCGWSAYHGWTLSGRVMFTVRRGEIVWDAARERFGLPDGIWLPAETPAEPENRHVRTHAAVGGRPPPRM